MEVKLTVTLNLGSFEVPIAGVIETPTGRKIDVKPGDNISCAGDRLYINGVYVS
jgi:hypothetical protein